MKPHSMFFDEGYSEKYYRKNTVQHFVDECDALIVVGTTLKTSFAKSIVQECINREVVPAIEVNLESFIEVGFVNKVVQKSEIALPEIFEEFYNLKKAMPVNKIPVG